MKKIVLLSLLGIGVTSAFAQLKQSSLIANEPIKAMDQSEVKTFKKGATSKYDAMAFAKTTATPFQTYTFAGGTASTLPTGWTAGSMGALPQGATWKWRNTACTGNFNMGTINSTSASDGWMVYDSDSIGSAYPTTDPLVGWLQSPSINCASHGSVRISFQEWFRTFRDSCFVDVSHDNGSTWDTFRIAVNNDMGDNTSLPSNPTLVRLNISSAAANQANVLIRFRYVAGQNTAGGSFNWLIDDVELSELDSVETGVSGGGTVMATGFDDTTSFGSIPKQFINDTLLPVVFLENNGLNTLTNAQVSATVYNGTTQVNTQNATVASLPSGASDVPVWFPPYNTTAVGTYSTVFASNQAGDPVTDNDVDTATFVISDSVYHRYGGRVQGSYRIHSTASSTEPERSFQIGTLFEIGPNTTDTLTAVYASFSSSTTANSNVRAIVYKEANGSWNRIKISNQKTLTAADITQSGASSVTYARIVMPANTIISSGNYIVVISGDNIPSSNDVLLLAGEPAGSSKINLLVGVADTSLNNPVSNSFSLLGSIASSPLLRLVFGNTGTPGDTSTIAVNDVTIAQVGDAYPNPTNSMINIPFTLTEAATVNVVITNAVGATMAVKNMGKYNAHQEGTASFNVSGFANGIYFYTVEVNGQRSTKRFVITK